MDGCRPPSKAPSANPTPMPTSTPTQEPTRFDCADMYEICDVLECYDSPCYSLGCYDLDGSGGGNNEFNNNNNNIQCPNYDTTTYSDCYFDTHCDDCQNWGCQTCESGYYKMDNLQACQSCTSNYPNCVQCDDWNGCTVCASGYTLEWDQTCQDQICK